MTSNTFLRAFALAALLAVPGAASAQSDEASTATETLPVGRPVQDIGTTYIAETHGDWEIRCIRAEEGQPEPCQLYQLLVDQAGNPVAEFNLFDLPDEGQIVAGATIVTPLDTLLPPGMRLRVDDGQWAEYPFAFCQQVGCFSRLGLTAADIEAMRNGGVASVAIVPLPAPDQIVELEASLIGFTAGFEALEARTATAAGLFDGLSLD
jgi:invasion protein IalB